MDADDPSNDPELQTHVGGRGIEIGFRDGAFVAAVDGIRNGSGVAAFDAGRFEVLVGGERVESTAVRGVSPAAGRVKIQSGRNRRAVRTATIPAP